jgi:hypothetical protein
MLCWEGGGEGVAEGAGAPALRWGAVVLLLGNAKGLMAARRGYEQALLM